MKGSRMSLPTQMAIGMVLGIAAGALTPAMGLDPSWYKPVGQLFINLVRMVVVPLVLTTLVAGAASVGDVSKLGRVAGKTLAYYLVTTAVAVVIGLVLANIFQPGSGLSISTEGLKAKDVAPPTLVDVFLNIVPINPIEALSKGNMLQIIFFALLFGFGLSVIGDKGKQVLHFFDGAADVMIKVTGFVMLYAPIGVFGLMAYTVSMHGLSVLLPLIKLVLVMREGHGPYPQPLPQGPRLPDDDRLHHLLQRRRPLHHAPQRPEARRVPVRVFLLHPARQHHQHGRRGHLHGHRRHLRRRGLRHPHAAR